MSNLKKIIITILISLFIISFETNNTNAGFFGDGQEKIEYCKGDDCGIKKGIDAVKDSNIDGLKTEGTASEQVQNIIIYLLSFITLIAVIFIIYAGFRILVSSGDDDTLKKSKNTIIYVIVGIIVIWFAWSIANFATNIGNGGV